MTCTYTHLCYSVKYSLILVGDMRKGHFLYEVLQYECGVEPTVYGKRPLLGSSGAGQPALYGPGQHALRHPDTLGHTPHVGRQRLPRTHIMVPVYVGPHLVDGRHLHQGAKHFSIDSFLTLFLKLKDVVNRSNQNNEFKS